MRGSIDRALCAGEREGEKEKGREVSEEEALKKASRSNEPLTSSSCGPPLPLA